MDAMADNLLCGAWRAMAIWPPCFVPEGQNAIFPMTGAGSVRPILWTCFNLLLTDIVKISRRIQARSGTKLFTSAPYSWTLASSLAMAPGTSGRLALNLQSRPSAAMPRSITRAMRLLLMLPPDRMHTTLGGGNNLKAAFPLMLPSDSYVCHAYEYAF